MGSECLISNVFLHSQEQLKSKAGNSLQKKGLPSVYCREDVSNWSRYLMGNEPYVIVSKASKDSVHSSAILLSGSCSRLSAWALKVSELARLRPFLYILDTDTYCVCLAVRSLYADSG